MAERRDRRRGWLLAAAMLAPLACAFPTGCIHYQPKPLTAESTLDQLEARRLDAPELAQFLLQNAGISDWPPPVWDPDALTLAALFYSPELDVARARWGVASAGTVTAGARPNPAATAAMGYNADAASGVRPWIPELVLGLPLETAGKRGIRVIEARHLSEAARRDVISTAWSVRARVRRACLNLHIARRTGSLLSSQSDLEAEAVELLEKQHELGEVSANEVAQARIARDHANLAALEAERKSREALAELAAAIGLPAGALEGTVFSFDALEKVEIDPTTQEIRRQALTSRADILAELSRYEASQAALRLEIARQYPDIDIGAGYQLDQTDSKWTLSLSLPIPILNRNKGPIAEAEARRRQAAAAFLALQARVISEVDGAIAACRTTTQLVTAADAMLSELERAEGVSESAYRLGEISRLDLVGARLEVEAGRIARLEALSRAQEAFGDLEGAMQSPLQMADWVLKSGDDG